MKLDISDRHVDVFEAGLGGDSFYAVGGFYEVVSGTARLFAAESVGKDQRFGELTSAHQKTGAVDGPLAFTIHSHFFHPSARAGVGFWLSGFTSHQAGSPLGGMRVASGVTVRAQGRRVNTIRIVQRWNFRRRIGGQEYGSSRGRGQLRLAYEGRGLS